MSPFIKDDLGFTDAQLGWLKGFAFAAFYCTIAIPIALLADRYKPGEDRDFQLGSLVGLHRADRVWPAVSCPCWWREWAWAWAKRAGPRRRIRSSRISTPRKSVPPLSASISLGIPFGIMFAYFAAGLLIASVGWRGTLIVLGLAGIALALILLLLIREPERGAMDVATSSEPAPKVPYSQMLKTLLSIPSWWLMCFGIAFISFGGYAISNWGMDYLVRWDPTLKEPARYRNLNMVFGLMNGVAYGLGTYGGAKLADILGKRSVSAYGWLPGVVLLIGVPALLYAFWVDSLVMHLLLITVYLVTAGFYLGPSFAIAQTLAPIRMRAMSTALFFFILNMIALGGGPTFVGILSSALEPLHGETHALRLSLTWLWVPYLIGIIAFVWAGRTLPKDWAEAEARNARG